MVERAAVNREVVGSSPTSGAILFVPQNQGFSDRESVENGQMSADLSAKSSLEQFKSNEN